MITLPYFFFPYLFPPYFTFLYLTLSHEMKKLTSVSDLGKGICSCVVIHPIAVLDGFSENRFDICYHFKNLMKKQQTYIL